MTSYPIRPVDSVKDSFYCPHCEQILRAAIQTGEGDRLCEPCYQEIRAMPASTCKKCGIYVPIESQVYPDRAARREISELQVMCPYVETGCQWTGKLSVVPEHALHCTFKSIKCPHHVHGCEMWVTASSLELHIQECSYRQIECKYCGLPLQYNQLADHYQSSCQEYREPCRQCGMPISRRGMPTHLEEACSITKCTVCGKLMERSTRKEVLEGEVGKVHLCTNEAVFDHTQTLGKKTEEIVKRQENIEKEMRQLKYDIGKSDTVNHLQAKVEALAVDIDHLKSNKNDIDSSSLVQELQAQLNQQQTKIQHQKKCYTDLIQEVESLKNTVAQILSSEVKGPVAYPEASRHQFALTAESSLNRTTELQLSDVENESRIAYLYKTVEELLRSTTMVKVHVAEVELQLQASLASTHDGTFLWRIPEIARRRRDALQGSITSVYSPPFYTGRNGYKMCIRAYLNGDGIGAGTHLSVFFVLMRGEYDPLLNWPFAHKVSLILVAQGNRRHIIQTFRPTSESSSFQRPQTDMNVASGCPKLADLSVLEEGNYVKDDVLFIKCVVDTSKIVHP